jgi:hypothetical protein
VFRLIAIAHFGASRSLVSEHHDRPFRASRSPVSAITITPQSRPVGGLVGGVIGPAATVPRASEKPAVR